MQPNQDPDLYPIDYLNQISPAEQQRGPSSRLMIIALVVGVLAVITFIFILFSGGGSSSLDSQATSLDARLTTLKTIVDAQHKTIRENDLRSANSSLSVFLSSAQSELKAPLSGISSKVGKSDKKQSAAEKAYADKLTATFTDAALAGTFDRVYAREMTYQIDILVSIMQDIYDKTKNKSLQTILEKTDNSIQPIKKVYSEFAATK